MRKAWEEEEDEEERKRQRRRRREGEAFVLSDEWRRGGRGEGADPATRYWLSSPRPGAAILMQPLCSSSAATCARPASVPVPFSPASCANSSAPVIPLAFKGPAPHFDLLRPLPCPSPPSCPPLARCTTSSGQLWARSRYRDRHQSDSQSLSANFLISPHLMLQCLI